MSRSGLHGRLWRLCQKELKETIRDRRTIVTLLLMPLLVYPLLSMGLNRFLLTSAVDGGVEEAYTIGMQTEEEGLLLRAWLLDPLSTPPDAIVKAADGGLTNFKIVVTAEDTPEQALRENKIDIGAKIEMTSPPKVTFIAFAGDNASQMCQRVLTERMQWLRMRFAETAAAEYTPNFLPPVRVEVEDLGEAPQASALATIVPLVLVLMTITGAVYPAIDLTAGERERGTMESLMASPVPRFYVLFAKYVAVVTVALLTAIANLLAMFTTLWASRLLPLLTGGSEDFPWIAVLQILGLLILFSGFFSAVLLSLTSFAKSFKEAQAYLIPVMLLSLTPGMLALMPGVNLSGPMAIAPLINIVLLARDVLSGSVPPAAALAAVISTVAYASAALVIAAKLFGSDAVTRTSEQSIGSIFRRPLHESHVPSVQSAVLMLAMLVPIYFVVSNVLIRIVSTSAQSLTISTQLLLNAFALMATFGLVPLLAAYFGRNRLHTTYRLTRPTATSIVGAVLIGLGAWAVAYEAIVLADAMGIGGLDEERIRKTLGRLDAFTKAPPLLMVACLALTPAIIEELCFRGFLFSSLSKVLSPARVIVITSLIFGLFHVLTGNALLIERFVPSTLLGFLLGWLAYRTGSVIPGMVMHFVNNALLELVAHYHEDLKFLGDAVGNDRHLPTSWFLTATPIAILGIAVILISTKKAAPKLEVQAVTT